MLRKFLGAVLTAAMMFAVGGGAFGADVYYTAGGGGGGGAATNGSSGGTAGNGSGRVEGGSASSATGGAGGTALGGAGVAGGGSSLVAGQGRPATPNDDPFGDQGGAGNPLAWANGTPVVIDFADLPSVPNQGETIHILGGDGGGGGIGTGSSGQNGGSGGYGGEANVQLVGDASVNFNITIGGGNGGNGGANTLAGSHGSGGHAGNVTVVANDPLELTNNATITVAGGDAGSAGGNMSTARNGGTGGNASFTATTITLDSATIAVNNGAKPEEIGQLSPSPNPVTPVGGNASFSVGTLAAGAGGGTFTTANGQAYAAGMGLRTVNIAALNAIDGNFALDFDTFDFTNETMSIGAVTVGDAAATAKATTRTLEVSNGTLNMAENWNGVLNVFGVATLGGVDLSGATVTVDVDELTDLDITSDVLLTKGTNAMMVDGNTKVSVKINAAQKTDFIGDGSTGGMKVIDTNATGVASLDGKKFTIWNGAESTTALFDNGGVAATESVALVFATDPGAGGAAYNAMLAAPALMSLVNTGADAVEKAAGSFSPMLFMNSGSGVQFGMFASMGAASIDVDTGSGVDSDSFHMLIGPGLRVNNGTGKTDFGAFFEAGWGGYDAYSGVYRGEGDTEYYGGGLILRHDTRFGLYGEASLRMGAADTDYHNRDGLDTDYDMDSSYVGGHLGLGYILRPSECSSLDFFAKGILTHVSDESAKDKAGNTVTVDDTDSFRTQLGAKYSYNFGQNASFFVKGAWEHEFDGETGGSYNAARIAKNADTSGSSVIGELGVDVRVSERVSLAASVYGIAGQRKGFGGNLSLGIGF